MADVNDPNPKLDGLFGDGKENETQSGYQPQEGATETPKQQAERLHDKYKLRPKKLIGGKSIERSLKSKERMLDGAASFDNLLDKIENKDEKRLAIEERVEEILTDLFTESSTEARAFYTPREVVWNAVLGQMQRWMSENSPYTVSAYEAVKMRDPHFAKRVFTIGLAEIKAYRSKEDMKENSHLRDFGRSRARAQAIERDVQEWGTLSSKYLLEKEEHSKELSEILSDLADARDNPECAEICAMLEDRAKDKELVIGNIDYKLKQIDRQARTRGREWEKITGGMNRSGFDASNSKKGEAELYEAEEAYTDRLEEIEKYINMIGETEDKPNFRLKPAAIIQLGNRTMAEEKNGTLKTQQYEAPRQTEYVPESDLQNYRRQKEERFAETVQLSVDSKSKENSELGEGPRNVLEKMRAHQKSYRA